MARLDLFTPSPALGHLVQPVQDQQAALLDQMFVQQRLKAGQALAQPVGQIGPERLRVGVQGVDLGRKAAQHHAHRQQRTEGPLVAQPRQIGMLQPQHVAGQAEGQEVGKGRLARPRIAQQRGIRLRGHKGQRRLALRSPPSKGSSAGSRTAAHVCPAHPRPSAPCPAQCRPRPVPAASPPVRPRPADPRPTGPACPCP